MRLPLVIRQESEQWGSAQTENQVDFNCSHKKTACASLFKRKTIGRTHSYSITEITPGRAVSMCV